MTAARERGVKGSCLGKGVYDRDMYTRDMRVNDSCLVEGVYDRDMYARDRRDR